MRNIERIRNMTVDEMAEFLEHIYHNDEHTKMIIAGTIMHIVDIKQWLESEADK